VHTIAELDKNIRNKITPFFDYPRSQKPQSEDEVKKTIARIVKKFKTHLSDINEFYFDIFDVDDTEINGIHLYGFLLQSFYEFPIVPVVSIDRSGDHLDSVIKAKSEGILASDVVAFRATYEDFQSFGVVNDDIQDMLSSVFSLFEAVDLILDCRFCANSDVKNTSTSIHNFIEKFSNSYSVRRVIITGSSIPASVANVLPSNSEAFVDRAEIRIYSGAKDISNKNYIFGDYTIISPDYSDPVPGEQMQGRITAKFIYSFDDQHYFIRGGSLKTKGRDQYFDMAETLCSKEFFRGAEYSWGDEYFEKKSRRLGDQCWVTTVIKPAINAHITYAVNDLLTDNFI
jgi:hypothetical protein